MMEEQVILVDESDRQVGVAEKLQAHKDGLLHRAFSIFAIDAKGRLLLQKRAKNKYHSGGLWTNTCCSHPRPGEATATAARRRLKEEMGIDLPLTEIFSFIYRAELDRNLIEHEFDRVFIGHFDGEPTLNPEEAEEWKWIDLRKLKEDIRQNPNLYTYWLKDCIDKFIAYVESSKKTNG